MIRTFLHMLHVLRYTYSSNILLQVLPPPIPGDEVLNSVLSGVSGDSSAVSDYLSHGDRQEAATLVFSYISLINVPAHMVM